MELKTASNKDANELRDLIHQAIDEGNSQDYSKEDINSWKNFADIEHIKDKIRNESLRNYLAVDEKTKEIIGYISFSSKQSILHALYIRPDHMKKGIGSELLEFCEMILRSKGLKELKVNSTKTAKNFYKKKGFKKIKDNNLDINSTKIPIIEMIKNL